MSNNDTEKASHELQDTHSRTFSTGRRLLILWATAFVQFISFLDQTAVTTAIPSIGSDLHIGPGISWVFSSFLASSTTTQLIVGRLSDIFGRKACVMTALFVMCIGNLMTGFARQEILLYFWRAISGLGAGCLNSQAMIIITDITTVKQRGKYFGVIGVAIAFGNGLGPLVGGYLTEKAGWQWAFWVVSPMCVIVIVLLGLALPGSGQNQNIMQKLRLIDWLGVLLTLGGTFLVLIPVSEGGSAFPFDSPIFFVPLMVGLLMYVAFVLVEWKLARFPIMPMRLFTTGYAAQSYLWQNLAYGWVFFGNLYFTPIYFQNVRGDSPSRSGLLILPMVLTHGMTSAMSGNAVSKTGKCAWTIVAGTFFWTAGLAAQAGVYSRTTPIAVLAGIQVIIGLGIGGCFQPNLIGLLANSYKSDRAVASAMRFFIRAVGGALGIAVSNAILNNVLRAGLRGSIPENIIAPLASSTAGLAKLGLDHSQQELVKDTYMRAMHLIFIVFAPLMGLAFFSSLFIKERGLEPIDVRQQKEAATETSTSSSSTNDRSLESASREDCASSSSSSSASTVSLSQESSHTEVEDDAPGGDGKTGEGKTDEGKTGAEFEEIKVKPSSAAIKA